MNHVLCKEGTVKCGHCSEAIPLPTGEARFVADVIIAFTAVHSQCDRRDRRDEPLCIMHASDGGYYR